MVVVTVTLRRSGPSDEAAARLLLMLAVDHWGDAEESGLMSLSSPPAVDQPSDSNPPSTLI